MHLLLKLFSYLEIFYYLQLIELVYQCNNITVTTMFRLPISTIIIIKNKNRKLKYTITKMIFLINEKIKITFLKIRCALYTFE